MTERDAPPAESSEAVSPAAPVPPAPRAVEPELIGGRAWLGIGMLAAIGFVAWQWPNAIIDRTLHPKQPKPAATWAVGSEADVELTLITADAKRLSCAHDKSVKDEQGNDVHCAFTASKNRVRLTQN